MKDLIILTITGIFFWWVAMWPEPVWADVLFDDNRVMIYITVLSF